MVFEEFLKVLNQKGIKLNYKQEEVASTIHGPVLCVAVPGAGKTLTTVVRIANMILVHNINPKNILALTFSKASAKDMKKRFKDKFGDIIQEEVHFSTIHSIAYSITREYLFKQGMNPRLIDSEDSTIGKMKILKEIYKKYSIDDVTDDKVEEFASAIGYVKNLLIDLNEENNFLTEINIPNFVDMYNEYEDYKEMNGYIDFDDMLIIALEALNNDADILNKYQNRYLYAILDEGQDTSKVQYDIVGKIIEKSNNICVVGDDDQTLYSFRGADVHKFLNFEYMYPNTRKIFMEQNYRSSKDIIEVSNKFIKRNKNRYNKELFTENPTYKKILINEFTTTSDQLSFIIKQLNNESDLKEIAILYRNNISALELVDKLDRAKIPFYVRDLKLHYFKHWVTKDLLSFVKFVVDPTNKNAFSNIAFKLKKYISRDILNYIIEGYDNENILDKLLTYPTLTNQMEETFRIFKQEIIRLQDKTPIQILNYFERNYGYKNYIKENAEKTGYTFDTLKNILSITKSIAMDCKEPNEFLERIIYLEELLSSSKHYEGVVLSSIHSSKGLEWDKVYIIDLVNGTFPSYNALELEKNGDSSQIEEEARTMYVGMTRARKELTLCIPSEKNGDKVEPSIFVMEIKNILNPSSKKTKKKDLEFNIQPNIKEEINMPKKETNIQFKTKPIEVVTKISSNNYDVVEGDIIIHKTFGEGVIKKIGNIAEVQFNNSLKKINIAICLKNNIITLKK